MVDRTIFFAAGMCLVEYSNGSLFQLVDGAELPSDFDMKSYRRERNRCRISRLRVALANATNPERIASLTEELERRCAVRLSPTV